MAHYGLLHQDRLNPLQWGRQNPNMPGAMSGDPSWGGALLGSGHQDPRAADPLLWSAGMRGGAGLVSQIPRAAEFAGRGAQEIWDSPIGGLVRSGDWRAPAEALLLDKFKKKAEQEFDPMRRKILQGVAGSVVDNPLIPLAGELLPKAIEAVPEVTSAGSLEVFANHIDNIIRNYVETRDELDPIKKRLMETPDYSTMEHDSVNYELESARNEYRTSMYPLRRVIQRIRGLRPPSGLLASKDAGARMTEVYEDWEYPPYDAEWAGVREITYKEDGSQETRMIYDEPINIFGEVPGVDKELGIIHWMRDYEPKKYKLHIERAIDFAEIQKEEIEEEIEGYKRTHIDNIDLLTMTGFQEKNQKLLEIEEDLTWLDALLNDDPGSLPLPVTEENYGGSIFDEWKPGDSFPREIPHRDYAVLEDKDSSLLLNDRGQPSYNPDEPLIRIDEVTRGAGNFARDWNSRVEPEGE